MAIYVGNKKATLYRGDYHPAALYIGETKIAGWEEQEETGTVITAAHTYRERLTWRATCVSKRVYSKNNLPYPYQETTKTVSGITFTDNGDGTVGVYGTATEGASFWFYGGENPLPPGTYTASGCHDGSPGIYKTNLILRNAASAVLTSFNQFTSGETFTVTSDCKIMQFFIYVYAGKSVNTTFYPQIEAGVTATAYEPYVAVPPALLSTDTDVVSENADGTESTVCHISGNGIGSWCDSVESVDGCVRKTKRTTVIASYHGEAVPTSYLSSTGDLRVGARVIYVTPPITEDITATAEGQAILAMQTHPGYTKIRSVGQTCKPILTATVKHS